MEVTNLKIVSGLVAGNYQINLNWENPTTAFQKVRIVWKTDGVPLSVSDGTVHEITDGARCWTHTNLMVDTTYYYSVFVYDGSWGTAVSGEFLTGDTFQYGTVAVFVVKDVADAPLVSHNVTLTRVRNAKLMGTKTSDTNGWAVFDEIQGESGSSVLWVGDELVVLVESAPGVTVFERNITLDGTMVSTDGIHVEVAPATVVAQYPATPTIPVGVNPATTSMTRPSFVWNHTPDPDNSPSAGKVHYAIEMDTNADFSLPHSANYRLYKSVDDATAFEYSLESSSYATWLPFPVAGLFETGNARIRFTVPTSAAALTETTWRWRVYSTDLTPA